MHFCRHQFMDTNSFTLLAVKGIKYHPGGVKLFDTAGLGIRSVELDGDALEATWQIEEDHRGYISSCQRAWTCDGKRAQEVTVDQLYQSLLPDITDARTQLTDAVSRGKFNRARALAHQIRYACDASDRKFDRQLCDDLDFVSKLQYVCTTKTYGDMPALYGTALQVAWASNLRRRAFKHLNYLRTRDKFPSIVTHVEAALRSTGDSSVWVSVFGPNCTAHCTLTEMFAFCRRVGATHPLSNSLYTWEKQVCSCS